MCRAPRMESKPDEVPGDYEERDFAPAERARLRKQMREWDRCHWAWRATLQGLIYSIGAVTALYALREPLGRVWRALFGSAP